MSPAISDLRICALVVHGSRTEQDPGKSNMIVCTASTEAPFLFEKREWRRDGGNMASDRSDEDPKGKVVTKSALGVDNCQEFEWADRE